MSVVSVVAKILETIVSTQLSFYLEINNLFHHHQGDYHHGKSTEDIFLVVVDSIIHHLDVGSLFVQHVWTWEWHSIFLTTLFC